MKELIALCLVLMVLGAVGCKSKEKKGETTGKVGEVRSTQTAVRVEPKKTTADVEMVKCAVCGKEIPAVAPDGKRVTVCAACREKAEKQMAELQKLIEQMVAKCPDCGAKLTSREDTDGNVIMVCLKCGKQVDVGRK